MSDLRSRLIYLVDEHCGSSWQLCCPSVDVCMIKLVSMLTSRSRSGSITADLLTMPATGATTVVKLGWMDVNVFHMKRPSVVNHECMVFLSRHA